MSLTFGSMQEDERRQSGTTVHCHWHYRYAENNNRFYLSWGVTILVNYTSGNACILCFFGLAPDGVCGCGWFLCFLVLDFLIWYSWFFYLIWCFFKFVLSVRLCPVISHNILLCFIREAMLCLTYFDCVVGEDCLGWFYCTRILESLLLFLGV